MHCMTKLRTSERQREREQDTRSILCTRTLTRYVCRGQGAAGANACVRGGAPRSHRPARTKRYDGVSSSLGVRHTAFVSRLKTREVSCSSENSAGAAPCASAGPSRTALPSSDGTSRAAVCGMSSTTWAPQRLGNGGGAGGDVRMEGRSLREGGGRRAGGSGRDSRLPVDRRHRGDRDVVELRV